MEVYLLENFRCVWVCFTCSIFLRRFCLIYTSLFIGESIIDFTLDCMISREVDLFWNAALLVLKLCHSLRDLRLVLIGKNGSTVGGTRTRRSGSGSGGS